VKEVKEEGSGKNKTKTGEDGSQLPEKRDTIYTHINSISLQLPGFPHKQQLLRHYGTVQCLNIYITNVKAPNFDSGLYTFENFDYR